MSKLSETDFSFGWFEWRCVEFFFKASTAKITVREVKFVFWLVDWNLSGPRTNPHAKFLLDLCVLMMWSEWGWSFGEGANFSF